MILRETLLRFGDTGGDKAIPLTFAGSGPSGDSGDVGLRQSISSILLTLAGSGGDGAISLTLAGSGPSGDSGGVRLSGTISSIFARTGTASVLVLGPTGTKSGAKAAFFLSDGADAGFFWTRFCFIGSGKPSG